MNLLLTQTLCAGLRTLRVDGHPSPASRRVRDRAGLHVHHAQIAAPGDEGRRQEPHPGRTHPLAQPSNTELVLTETVLGLPERPRAPSRRQRCG
jgi:hypothetical protein